MNYKKRKREEKNKSSKQENQPKIKMISEPINEREFLTVKQASTLLNISTKTLYRLIESNDLNAIKFSERKTLIRRKDIDTFFETKFEKINAYKTNAIETADFTPENSYTLQEAQEIFNISPSALYNIIIKHHIPKKRYGNGKYTLVRKEDLDKIFNLNTI